MRADIEGWHPTLWVFGHTHFDVDEMIGETRMLSRQRGYIGQEIGTVDFRPAVVEI